MPDELSARRFVVQGRVQGVGYRWYVRNLAESLGVRGWARNMPDGSVEVVALATVRTLGELESALREGPAFAHVSTMEVTDIPHRDVDFKSFTIKH